MSRDGAGEMHREVAARILALKEEGETDSAFARRLGVTPQLVSNYRAGRHGASLEAVAQVVENTDVGPRWLLTGQGPRRRYASDEANEAVAGIVDEILQSFDAVMKEMELRFGASGDRPPGS